MLASTVTFLSLLVEGACSVETVQSFPNLVECALACDDRDLPAHNRTSGRSLGRFTDLLARLVQNTQVKTSKLRAILIKDGNGTPLPVSEAGFLTLDIKLPRRLEYVTWLAADRSVQHFRVIRGPVVEEVFACLQLLPSIFRPKVDHQTGFWEDIFDFRDGYALFDHLSGDEPRLKYA
ncbi:hypothetical protein V8E36_002082 [Tilletia maclaganii]